MNSVKLTAYNVVYIFVEDCSCFAFFVTNDLLNPLAIACTASKVQYNYFQYGSNILLCICLSVCLLATSHKNY